MYKVVLFLIYYLKINLIYWNSVTSNYQCNNIYRERNNISFLSPRRERCILLLLRICYHKISLRLGMLNCFDCESLSGTKRSGKARLEKFRRSANDRVPSASLALKTIHCHSSLNYSFAI